MENVMDKFHQPAYLITLEERLHAIAPRDLSDTAKQECDVYIDKLVIASGKNLNEEVALSDELPTSKKLPRSWIWKSAAAITLGIASWLVGFWSSGEVASPDAARLVVDLPVRSDFTLLKSVQRVGGHESDGLIIPTDGSGPHYRHRYHIIGEQQMRDMGSGAVITIRQPRQEVITVPVTNF
ncbi:MAG TPA: hypothetical protein DHW77_08930 [Verrucomicrobiales bacterium]|jgi:hypothetical protein|nr:hypothetical protein [Verrucomicrobiales bacterium]